MPAQTDVTSTTPKTSSFLRRVLRRLVVLTTTTATVALAAGAVMIGADYLSARATAAAPVVEAEQIPVRVSLLDQENGYTVTRRFTGQIEAAQDTPLAFEFAGLVSDVLVNEGQMVQPEQPLARLDTALLDAERSRLLASRQALEAQLAFAVASTERREALTERGFTSAEAFDQARFAQAELTARIAETDAAIAAVDIRIEKSTLRAPFAGRIGARAVDTGATLAGGAPVLSLLEHAAPQLRVGLPVDLTLAPDRLHAVQIDGQVYDATLVALRPDVDPVTRTRTALFAVKDAPDTAFGRTVALELERQISTSGTWVPVQALREGAQGLWTVLVLDDTDIVRPAAVEILHTETTRAFVRGSFAPGSRLVEAGPHRVTPGQRVTVLSDQQPLELAEN